MTGAEFLKRMTEIAQLRDPEIGHGMADDLMSEALAARGGEWADGIAVFDSMTKWYA